MKSCRICDSPLTIFLDLGMMPRGNGFLTPDEFAHEFKFPLAAAFCASCTAVQLIEQPPAESIFHETYPFFTGSSVRMKTHFKELAGEIKVRSLADKNNPLVIEIGSNDGTLLKNFAEAGYRHLGLEPAAGAAVQARAAGVTTEIAFFNEEIASEILRTHGPADALIGANVFCHIDSIRSAAQGVKRLLNSSGAATFEDPYFIDMLEKTAYDQIYDEHVFIFSVTVLDNLFKSCGLELKDVKRIPTHGGSIRYWVGHAGSAPLRSQSVDAILREEEGQGVGQLETYQKFQEKVKTASRDLKALLEKLKNEGARLAGYAATSKSTTLLNFAGIGPELIAFISDTTDFKQGKFSPGMHIPVVSPEKFRPPYPDYVLLLAWNHVEEIMEKEKDFVKKGGRWILPVPRLEIKP